MVCYYNALTKLIRYIACKMKDFNQISSIINNLQRKKSNQSVTGQTNLLENLSKKLLSMEDWQNVLKPKAIRSCLVRSSRFENKNKNHNCFIFSVFCVKWYEKVNVISLLTLSFSKVFCLSMKCLSLVSNFYG